MASLPRPQQSGAIATFLDGLMQQGAVLRALCLRELQQRFGRDNIGYLWVVGEPMMLASVVTLLHRLVTRHEANGFSPFTFMLTGYSIYIIFRGTFNRSEDALHASETLFYHGMITPFDVMVAKWLVEVLGCVSALVILQTLGIMVGLSEFPARPLYLIEAVGLFAWWSLVLSLIASAYAYISPLVGRLLAPLSYFALPLSGAFLTMSVLPKWAHPAMAWNPMMSVFELARYGQFDQATDRYVHTGYVVVITVFCTYWGLLEIRRIRKRIHVP